MKTSKSLAFLDLKKLNDDFEIPNDGKWTREKIMGKGAYGKVMECIYKPSMISFAVKRFERIFQDIQRGTRLLREITILSNISHTCLNKLVTIFPPKHIEHFEDTYLVLDKCDMDLKKLLRSNKYL